MPVLHAPPSVLTADTADLHARWKSALFVACGCFSTWLSMASKHGLLVGCLSVFLFMLHFLHSVVSWHCIIHLLACLLKPSGLLCKQWALQQQHCILYTMLYIYIYASSESIYTYIYFHLADSCVSVMQMIFHSRPIAIVLLVDMVALLMYNFSGMCVTGTTPTLSL